MKKMDHRGRKAGKEHPNWKGGRKYSGNGYVLIYCPGHPRANKNYVLEHILVAERKLGRSLKHGEVTHHINGICDDNRPENLTILTQGAHLRLHLMKLLPKRNTVIKLYVEKEWTTVEIGKKFNVDPSTVSSFLRYCNVTVRPRGFSSKLLTKKDRIIELYIEKKLTTRDIARKYKMHHSTIGAFLRNHGIKLRYPGRKKTESPDEK